jgi:hypothetical protein
MCIPREALVSGLLLRIERDGVVPTPSDLHALLGLGCMREDLYRAFAERAAARPDRPFTRAIEVLDAMG